MKYFVVKGSSEMTNTNLWKTKVNLSYSKLFGEKASLYLNLSGGFVKRIGDGAKDERIRVNDAFYIQNFKGIRNIGYYFDSQGKREGLCGDILGFDRYVSALIKIHQMKELPFLSSFAAKPFLFVNAALAPNRSSNNNWTDYLRFSTGVGVSFLSQVYTTAVAIECYFNIFVHKQKNELASDFQINIGIN